MGGPPYDCLANPLGAVRFTFDKATSSGADPASFDGKDWGAVDLFRHFISDGAALSQVPIIDSSTIKWVQPNTLVRFQGMIQDMLGNEFYAGAYKDGSSWRTNKFSDAAQLPMGSSVDMRVWERRLLYCVAIPGRNSWTQFSCDALRSQFMDLTANQREKRQRKDDEAVDPMQLNVLENEFRGSTIKKMRTDEDPSTSSEFQIRKTEGASPAFSMVPSAERNSLPCLVKVYDSPESDLKLNDVVEFIGVLAFDSKPAMDDNAHDEFADILTESDSVQFPPCEVPRLHCIIHKRLEAHDFLHGPHVVEPKAQTFRELRESLVKHLTALLGNDDIAAQFVLLHLLSKVHGRVDNAAVGKLSLNLTRLNKESASIFVPRLSHALKSLIPFTQCIPLTIEYLNSASFGPKKDYQINRLVPGVLQLADNTHLIFDETQLETGILNSVGVENTRLLKHLLDFQKVEYDFQYYKMEMATDVQTLVFSEGKSNILPADLVVPLQPSQVISSEPTQETVEAWRWYLATARSLSHSIGPEMQNVVENELVAARQADRSLGSQEFSRLLTMARLVSSSFGETTLSLEHWQFVMEIERLRRAR